MSEKKKRNYEIHEVLSDKQQETYDEWLFHIKAIHGEGNTKRYR
jgi:hypothetical protein